MKITINLKQCNHKIIYQQNNNKKCIKIMYKMSKRVCEKRVKQNNKINKHNINIKI